MPQPLTFGFLAAMVVLIAIVLMRTQRQYSRRGSAAPGYAPPKREPASPSGTLGVPPAAVDWEVQMHETARELLGRLDSKMAALGHLIGEADRAAGRLEAALDAARRQPAAPAPDAFQPLADNQAASLQAASGPSTRDPRYEEIYTLADYGYDAAEIAHRTQTPAGEVELILSLRGKR